MKENSLVSTCIEADSSKEWHDHVIKRVLDMQAFNVSMPNCPYQGEITKSCTSAWVFDNVLTEEQCLQLMPSANRKGYVLVFRGPSFITAEKVGFGILVYNPQKRYVYAVMFDAPELCSWLLSFVETYFSRRHQFQIDAALIT